MEAAQQTAQSMTQLMSKMLCPYGLNVRADKLSLPAYVQPVQVSDKATPDHDVFKLHISGATRTSKSAACTMEIALPKFDNRGAYTIAGVERAVCSKAYVDYSQPVDSIQKEYVFESKLQVLMDALNDILIRTLGDFFYTSRKPYKLAAQHLIDTWLKTSPYCQLVPNHPVAESSVPELVYFSEALDRSLDVEKRSYPEGLLGLVDPGSTSSSGSINMSYRFVKGTRIRAQKLQNSTSHMFCSAVEDNAVGLQYNPKRVHMLRSQFEQSLVLKESEEPLVQPADNKLHGVHLLTAIMHLGCNTYEDAIAVSESAAKRLTCIRKYTVNTSTSSGHVKINVSKGETVSPLTVLIEYVDRGTGREVKKCCDKLRGTGIVTDIRAYETLQYGIPMVRYRITVRTEYALQPGDKITTRGAIKGVASIVPDHMMPKTADGTVIECCISPESIYNRQSMVTFWEMMANEHCLKNGITLQSRPFKEGFGFEDLTLMGYGDKTQLYIKKNALEECTFVGHLFVLRLDKIASEIVCYQDGKAHLNEQGLPIDKASESGQRRDLAMSMAMESKGMTINLEHMMKDPYGVHMIRRIAGILKGSYEREARAGEDSARRD